MSETEVFLPVADLGDRYGIDRSRVYVRMQKLGIESEKQSGKAYLSPEQIKQMDALDEHIKGGGAIADFGQDRLARQPNVSRKTTGQDPTLPTLAIIHPDTIDYAVAAIAARFAPVRPLSNLEELQRAYECGWRLSSSYIAPLLGLKTMPTPKKGEEVVKWFGFVFSKKGRNGRETAWEISKD